MDDNFHLSSVKTATVFCPNDHPYSLPSFPAGPPSLVILATPNGIRLNGKRFIIKGANYFGLESDIHVPHGLWGGPQSTTIHEIATFLKNHDFNAVRLPFAVDAVLQNVAIDATKISNEVALTAAFTNSNSSTRKTTLRYLDVIDYTLQVFAAHKILVLLDAHLLSTSTIGSSELWYTSDSDATHFEDAWRILAKGYAHTWNVLGADLKNEPHGRATWGSVDVATDWRLAALQWATTIQAIAPHWLIFVEGIQFSSRDEVAFLCFWGENLMDVQRVNLSLPVAERLVFSPHVYGPDVVPQSYFSDANFPHNMAAIWDLHFGFVVDKNYGPVVVGEWGGKFRTDSDRQWQSAFAAY